MLKYIIKITCTSFSFFKWLLLQNFKLCMWLRFYFSCTALSWESLSKKSHQIDKRQEQQRKQATNKTPRMPVFSLFFFKKTTGQIHALLMLLMAPFLSSQFSCSQCCFKVFPSPHPCVHCQAHRHHLCSSSLTTFVFSPPAPPALFPVLYVLHSSPTPKVRKSLTFF